MRAAGWPRRPLCPAPAQEGEVSDDRQDSRACPTKDLNRKTLDKLLTVGEPEAAVVQSAIEDFAQDLAQVIRRFLKLKAWRDTERLAIGGGFRASRVGELVIGRADVILKSEISVRALSRADVDR